ncbi:hypothetical protein [Nonomuraea sp. JJY05]|uniref:hypothetical protein n=1 Tax=Nonomuraea sp. JJY05 TaxID=3350255 RepID=UPI00373F37C5
MTLTTVEAPEPDSDGLRLVPIPEGVAVPCIADWAIPASISGTPQSDRFGTLAIACLRIADDLETGYTGTENDARSRESHLRLFKRMLAEVMADIGPINLAVTSAQAREIADSFHPVGTSAQTIELDPGIVWDLLDQAGHGDHGGWTHDSRWPDVTCACGDAVFRIAVPAPAPR